MKKINLICSILVIALAMLIVSGATMAPVAQLQASTLKVAAADNSRGTEMFDSEGRYAVGRESLTVGSVYNFFGYDWYLVQVNDESKAATFWMVDPFAKTYFNKVSYSNNSGPIDGEHSNIWSNGYTNLAWKKTNGKISNLGESHVRAFLHQKFDEINNNAAYAKYKNKVKKGYVEGNNQINSQDVASFAIDNLSYAHDSIEHYQRKSITSPEELIAYLYLESNDGLWLPSVRDLMLWGIVNYNEGVFEFVENKRSLLGWSDTTNGSYSWLRTADKEFSDSVFAVSARMEYSAKFNQTSYLHYFPINDENVGVRPAIHLDITNIASEYQAHLDSLQSGNGNNAGNTNNPVNNIFGWIGDDWMKALFMTVCIFGVIGVSLVIIAVIARARRNKNK